MTLVDTGPFVALFDRSDREHARSVSLLKSVRGPACTTMPVLTEAFHMLQPGSQGADRLRDFVVNGGVGIWFMDMPAVIRAFELMEQYRDQPMDLADASLIVCAEQLRARNILTLDRQDFLVYRARIGHRSVALQIVQ